MNIHVTGVIVKWHTNYTQIKFPRYFREIVIFSNFYEVHDEKCSFFCRLVQHELNVAYETSIFFIKVHVA